MSGSHPGVYSDELGLVLSDHCPDTSVFPWITREPVPQQTERFNMQSQVCFFKENLPLSLSTDEKHDAEQ